MSGRANDADLDGLRVALCGSLEEIARHFWGEPTTVTRREMRWGRRGSRSVILTGAKAGRFFDNEAGTGGDVMGFIKAEIHGTFAEAAAWGRNWLGTATQDRPTPRPQPAHTAPGPDQDEARRVAYARRIVASSVPLERTLGAFYLMQVRGVPRPAAGWPEAIRWHPTHRAVLAVATAADGSVQACQRIHLGEDGQKVGPEEMARRGLLSVKITNGVLKGAAVRLPGRAPGLGAEGVETGLSGWSTGRATMIALGGLGGLPLSVFTVLLLDDDAPHSPASKAVARAQRNWRKAGIETVSCTPWAHRLHDKSDLNDVLVKSGLDAVRARIDRALDAGSHAARRVPLAIAKVRIAKPIVAFRDHVIISPDDPVAQAVKATTGSGKSHEARLVAVDLVRSLRADGSDEGVVVAIESHDLGDQHTQALAALAPELIAQSWRGMEQADPERPGLSMCQDVEMVREARASLLDVATHVCLPCPFKADCGYQRQKAKRADIWVAAHEVMTHPKPAAFGSTAALIVDESPEAAFLVGDDEPIELTVDALSLPVNIEGDLPATLKLGGWLRLLSDTMRKLRDGPLQRQAVLDAGLTHEGVVIAAKLTWRLKVEPRFSASMTRDERREAMVALDVNRVLGRMAMMWTALADLTADDGPAASGWIALATVSGQAGPQRVMQLKQRKALPESWHLPTLLIDAILDPVLLCEIWPHLEVVADVAVSSPTTRTRQVIDRSYSLAMLDCTVHLPDPVTGTCKANLGSQELKRRQRNLRKLHAVICHEARRFPGEMTAVICQKRIRVLLESMGRFPAGVIFGHHNAVAGMDTWADARLLIVVGRTQPTPTAVERQAEALTGRAIEHLKGWYPRVDATREMSDGSLLACEVEQHPDPICEAFRHKACEGGLLQVIGRPRGVRREGDQLLDILLLTDVPLDMPVDETLSAVDLDPSPDDLQLAAGGIAYAEPADASRAYPDLWHTPSAYRMAAERWRTSAYEDSIKGNVRHLGRVRYQQAGAGYRPVEALVDLSVVHDPRAVIEQAQGPIAAFELLQPPAAAAAYDPASQTRPSAGFEPVPGPDDHGGEGWMSPEESGTGPPDPGWAVQ